jgi:magnesium-transporting ATPase (P-type)
MVGDGVNDAAALALADVGVAVHGGTGASIAAADVVLTRDGTAPLLDLLDGARSVFRVIARNLVLSVAHNVVASALAVLGLVGPLLAAVLMPASSLVVTLSSALSRTFATSREPRRTRSGAASGRFEGHDPRLALLARNGSGRSEDGADAAPLRKKGRTTWS